MKGPSAHLEVAMRSRKPRFGDGAKALVLALAGVLAAGGVVLLGSPRDIVLAAGAALVFSFEQAAAVAILTSLRARHPTAERGATARRDEAWDVRLVVEFGDLQGLDVRAVVRLLAEWDVVAAVVGDELLEVRVGVAIRSDDGSGVEGALCAAIALVAEVLRLVAPADVVIKGATLTAGGPR